MLHHNFNNRRAAFPQLAFRGYGVYRASLANATAAKAAAPTIQAQASSQKTQLCKI